MVIFVVIDFLVHLTGNGAPVIQTLIKHTYVFTYELHGAIVLKMVTFIITAVRTSNPMK
jgi:hypothetical protein